jgi:hypothetical protein
MTVALYVTKIEMTDRKGAVVSVVIDSDLIGRLQLDVLADPTDGNPSEILQRVRERLMKFGNELLNAAGKPNSFLVSLPPPADYSSYSSAEIRATQQKSVID